MTVQYPLRDKEIESADRYLPLSQRRPQPPHSFVNRTSLPL